MLDKRFVRSFFNWLEAAPLPELLAKRTELEAALEGFREPEARRDARFLLKHLIREILEQQLFGRSNET
ncbi:MAG: hypothetical protein IPH26_17820 [Sterolibacteriaceae bacterium]|uniref:Uncharacterized protein n=1 Tax=Candidatus Methylophosphatis roskildensis TaxID=2899263 RepID=A0A9D7HN25_9PROT|nr:hypothetical protein [Candidatus Methylophosphatis roskildensis]